MHLLAAEPGVQSNLDFLRLLLIEKNSLFSPFCATHSLLLSPNLDDEAAHTTSFHGYGWS